MQIKQFLKTIEGLAPNTLKAYEQTLWQFHAFIKGEEPTDGEIKKFLSKYPASSLHRHKAAIKAYWEYRYPREPWPFTRRQFTAPRRRVPRYTKPQDVFLIMEQTDNEDDRMFIYTLFTLGCRISELMGIETTDLRDTGVEVITKGGHHRLKAVTKDFARELMNYAKRKNGKLFPNKYSYYYTRLKELGKAAGILDVSPHKLRHARAVDLLNKGMQLPYVQQFLGHASINTTAIYTEITGGELVEELEKVENARTES